MTPELAALEERRTRYGRVLIRKTYVAPNRRRTTDDHSFIV